MTATQGLREKKNLDVKRAFFKAAMALFRENGFEQTSVDEIAKRAGFSRATYFNHFGTKKGVLRFYGQELQLRVEQLLENLDPSAEPLEIIHEVLFIMAREAEAHRDDLKVIFIHSIQDPEYLKRMTPGRQSILNLLTGLLNEAQKKGQIRQDLPALEQAFHIMALYQGALMPIVAGTHDAESAIGSAWRFIMGGIGGGYPMAR